MVVFKYREEIGREGISIFRLFVAILFINPVLVFIGHRKDLIYVNGDNS